MKYLPIIGLTLNVIGSFIFIFDSNRLSGLLAKMVKHMAEGYGYWDAKTFKKDQIKGLERKITASKNFTRWGYILFIAGFILQLLPAYFRE